MKVSIESVDSVQRRLAFEIPAERVGQEVEKAYKTVQKQARLKGFRPGKVPRAVLEQYFGEQVVDDVSSLLVQESYPRAVEENELHVVTQPHITTEKLIPGQPFRYSATVEVRPAITITDYEGIEVEKQLETVAEEEVESTLQRLTESFTQLHPVLDREQVEDGDVLTLDYVALRDGRPVPGLEAKGRLIEMGRETLLPGFQDNLMGAQRGRALQFSVSLPKSEEQAEQIEGAGQETGSIKSAETSEQSLLFRVTIHDISRKEIPALDDDFAKDHGECETLEALRNKIRDNLQSAADRRVENQMHEALLAGIYEKNPFEVPPSLIREQLRQLFVESGIQRQEEDVSVGEGRLTDELREQFTVRARQSVQSAFLLDALIEHLSVSVTEEDVRQKIEELSASGAEQQRQVEAFYAKGENRQSLERQLMREKAIQAVVDKAQIKTVDKEVTGAQEKD
jgi:trigger factor